MRAFAIVSATVAALAFAACKLTANQAPVDPNYPITETVAHPRDAGKE